MSRSRVRSFLAGVLVGNSAPHLATAITRRRHLTPLAGRRSGPAVNGLWGLLNLLGGLLLLTPDAHRSPGKWDDDLVAFEGGVLALAAWMAVSERMLRTNTGPDVRRQPNVPMSATTIAHGKPPCGRP